MITSDVSRAWFTRPALALLAAGACFACGNASDDPTGTTPSNPRTSSSSAAAQPSSQHEDASAAGAGAEAQKPAAGAAQEGAASARGTSKEKRPIDPKSVGTIHGVIRLDGTPPARKEMAIGNATGCEKHPVPPLTEDVIASDGKLANVFVSIKAGFEGWIVPPPDGAPVVLNQEGCMYRPRVLGLRVGQKLSVHNSDPTNHNVHARPERNDGFNRTQAVGSAPVEWQPEKPELMVPFACDIHPWMKAWVAVRDHPWFAVSGADGAFTIPNVPPGQYTLEAWHEKYGKKTGKLTLAPSGSADITITYSAP
jgi:plastocyanin